MNDGIPTYSYATPFSFYRLPLVDSFCQPLLLTISHFDPPRFPFCRRPCGRVHREIEPPDRPVAVAERTRLSTDDNNTRPPQLLGRRQRSDHTENNELDPDHTRPKRRRAGSMSADGDGEASSNGTPRASLGDTRTQQRNNSHGPATNGNHKAHSTSSVNGSSARANGKQHSQSDDIPTTPYFGHDREEVTRILIQALSDLGHHAAAERVSRDSGYELESNTVAAFRAAVTKGSWSEAEELLFGALDPNNGNGQQRGKGLLLVEGADPDVMRFRIRQQKYLELLEQRDSRQALVVLRTELTPLGQDPEQLSFLSQFLMYQPEDIKAKARWDGAGGQSRHDLLADLSSAHPPSWPQPDPSCCCCCFADLTCSIHITNCYASRAPFSSPLPTG